MEDKSFEIINAPKKEAIETNNSCEIYEINEITLPMRMNDTSTCQYIKNVEPINFNQDTYNYTNCCLLPPPPPIKVTFSNPMETETIEKEKSQVPLEYYWKKKSSSTKHRNYRKKNQTCIVVPKPKNTNSLQPIILKDWEILNEASDTSKDYHYIDGCLENGRYRETSNILKLAVNPRHLDVLTVSGNLYRLYYHEMKSTNDTSEFNYFTNMIFSTNSIRF